MASRVPVYAVRADVRTNTVVVGPRESLARTSVDAAGRLYVPVEHVEAILEAMRAEGYDAERVG